MAIKRTSKKQGEGASLEKKNNVECKVEWKAERWAVGFRKDCIRLGRLGGGAGDALPAGCSERCKQMTKGSRGPEQMALESFPRSLVHEPAAPPNDL